ncbi:MAG: hypothetical protein WC956_04855 [bacterium]
MKRGIILVAMVVVAMFAACGGGGSGGDCTTAKAAAVQSYDAMGALVSDPAIQACFQLATPNCNCPGGGTAVADIPNFTVDLNDCKSAAGATFDGQVTISQDGTSINANMPTFDVCTNVVATDIQTQSCGGTITGTCSGVNLTCTLGLDANDPNVCTLTCNC